jgi:LPS export ABC transporter protein LptC
LDARNLAVVIVLAVAAMGSLAVYLGSDSGAPQGSSQAAPGIGYYATFARLTGTDRDGNPSYDLTADRVTQTLADGSIGLERVLVNYAPAGIPQWNLMADAGRISSGADIIELDGNVVATSADQRGPTTTIRTDSLRYDAATGVAETDRPVTVLYASSVVHARGLRARLREGRLELRAQVRGRYDP